MEEEEKSTPKDINLTGLGVKGYVRFSIKADDTPGNKAIHDGFKEFCRVETDNNYTQGLRKLLEYYQADFKFEAIWDKLSKLEFEINELDKKSKTKPEHREEKSTF